MRQRMYQPDGPVRLAKVFTLRVVVWGRRCKAGL